MTRSNQFAKVLQSLLGGGIVVLLAALVLTRIVSGNSPSVVESPAQLQGLTVRYALPTGDYVQRSFVSAGQAQWKMLSGARSGEGGVEEIAPKQIAPGIFFVNRVDRTTGETVSEIYNLATLTISTYITRPDPADPLRRVERFGDGRLEIVSSSAAGAVAR